MQRDATAAGVHLQCGSLWLSSVAVLLLRLLLQGIVARSSTVAGVMMRCGDAYGLLPHRHTRLHPLLLLAAAMCLSVTWCPLFGRLLLRRLLLWLLLLAGLQPLVPLVRLRLLATMRSWRLGL
jgi:hypothetical protein